MFYCLISKSVPNDYIFNFNFQLTNIAIRTEKIRQTNRKLGGNLYSLARYVCFSWSGKRLVRFGENLTYNDRINSIYLTELSVLYLNYVSLNCAIRWNAQKYEYRFCYRRIFIQQFGDRDRRLAFTYRFRQLYDIPVRLVGGLQTCYPVHAVRMVQGRSVGRPNVRPSHMGGHRCAIVLGRWAYHEHVVLDRRWYNAHHVRGWAVRELGVSTYSLYRRSFF